MGRRSVAHLTLVDTPSEYGETASAPAPAAALAASRGVAGESDGPVGSSAVANALMFQAVSWVALMLERACGEVSITPLGGQWYEVAVTLDGGEIVMLRVRLVLALGRVLQSIIEPAHP